ncbi:hypothetical protein BDW66DRAFT_158068 [Aspergillus desertorum]
MPSQLRKDDARSRRAARACARCHSRKVRCDGSLTGFPCTNCRLDARPCTLHSGKRDKGKQLIRAIAKERSNAYPTPAADRTKLTFVKSQMALKHYFLYVHPFLPVIDEAVFWTKYRSLDSRVGKISTLLFPTILFAASPMQADPTAPPRTGIEKDRLVISQACLLLTWYSTDAERSTNSRWLRIAIRYAKKEQAHLYHELPQSRPGRKVSDLKRLWWCCMIRDRIISLGMRRPIQITPDEFDLQLQEGLSFQDLEEECLNSEVYTPETKISLCGVLASLCHFVAAVPDVIMLVYPTPQNMPFSLADRRAQLNRLEGTKFTLLDWELNWVANPDESARIALCNRICSLIGQNAYLADETDLSRIESCRADLASAICATAHNVKQLILNGVADKLPISAYASSPLSRLAYTLFPQILLSIHTQLSPTPEDKELHELMLVFFTEVFRFLRSQYYTRLILAVSWKALESCRLQMQTQTLSQSRATFITGNTSIDSTTVSGDNGNSGNSSSEELILHNQSPLVPDNALFRYPALFQLKLTEYIRLLQYVDDFMSLRSAPEENAIYPAPAPAIPSQVQPERPQAHEQAKTYSQASSCTTSSLQPAVTATAPTAVSVVDSPKNSSAIYSNYFWIYFGEKELEGESPQTPVAADAGSPSSSSIGINGTDCGIVSGRENGNGESPRSQPSIPFTESGSPGTLVKREEHYSMMQIGVTCRESAMVPALADSPPTAVQNMLDCLPLLGE